MPASMHNNNPDTGSEDPYKVQDPGSRLVLHNNLETGWVLMARSTWLRAGSRLKHNNNQGGGGRVFLAKGLLQRLEGPDYKLTALSRLSGKR